MVGQSDQPVPDPAVLEDGRTVEPHCRIPGQEEFDETPGVVAHVVPGGRTEVDPLGDNFAEDFVVVLVDGMMGRPTCGHQ